jgi:hypothetical protein
MAGLVPAIQVYLSRICCKDVDARHKAGHDDFAIATVLETHCRAGSRALERADLITGKA